MIMLKRKRPNQIRINKRKLNLKKTKMMMKMGVK